MTSQLNPSDHAGRTGKGQRGFSRCLSWIRMSRWRLKLGALAVAGIAGSSGSGFLSSMFLNANQASSRVSSSRSVPSPPSFPEFDLGWKVEASQSSASSLPSHHCYARVSSKTFEDLFGDFSGLTKEAFLRAFDACEEAMVSEISESPSSSPYSPRPWVPAPFRRTVNFLVDALRFDWLVWDPLSQSWSQMGDSCAMPFCDASAIPGSPACSSLDNPARQPPMPGVNNFPFVHHLLSHPQWSQHVRLFRMIADVPTMTPQRIRGMMQGDLAPYFDIRRSFAGEFLEDHDSLPMQMRISLGTRAPSNHTRGRFIASGDDTWFRLYQRQVDSCFLDVGANIKDLDSVDNTVHQVLWKLLLMARDGRRDLEYYVGQLDNTVPHQQTRLYQDWEWLVGHTLDADHTCHSYGVQSPVLHTKLQTNDRMVGDIIYHLSGERVGLPVFSRELEERLEQNASVSHWQQEIRSLPLAMSEFCHDANLIRAGMATDFCHNVHLLDLPDAASSPVPLDYRYPSGCDNYQWEAERRTGRTGPRFHDQFHDTVFALYGDHGMLDGGNHGGGQKLEVEAGLMYWIPKPLVPLKVWRGRPILARSLPSSSARKAFDPIDAILSLDNVSKFEEAHGYAFRSIDQVDMTPTWSLLLGLPIPSNSFGALIPDIFPIYRRSSTWASGEEHQVRHSLGSVAERVPVVVCRDSLAALRLGAWPLFTPTLIKEGIRSNHIASLTEAQAGQLECRSTFGDDHIFVKFSEVPSAQWEADENHMQISKLGWLRHVRFLAEAHSLVVWSLRTRVLEDVPESSQRQTEQFMELEETWRDYRENYANALGRESSSRFWNVLFLTIETIETPPEAASMTAGNATLLGDTILTSPWTANEVLESEIEGIEKLIASMRGFIQLGQTQLRESQTSSLRHQEAWGLALLPLAILFAIILLKSWAPPLKLFDHLLMVTCACWIAIVALYCPGKSQFAMVAGQFICLWVLWYVWTPQPGPTSDISAHPKETLPRPTSHPPALHSSSSPPEGDSIRTRVNTNPEVEAATEANVSRRSPTSKWPAFSWFLNILVFGLVIGAQFSDGAAVQFVGVSTRYIFQILCLLLWYKDARQSDFQSGARGLSILRQVSWLLPLLAGRVGDVLDPLHGSPPISLRLEGYASADTVGTLVAATAVIISYATYTTRAGAIGNSDLTDKTASIECPSEIEGSCEISTDEDTVSIPDQARDSSRRVQKIVPRRHSLNDASRLRRPHTFDAAVTTHTRQRRRSSVPDRQPAAPLVTAGPTMHEVVAFVLNVCLVQLFFVFIVATEAAEKNHSAHESVGQASTRNGSWILGLATGGWLRFDSSVDTLVIVIPRLAFVLVLFSLVNAAVSFRHRKRNQSNWLWFVFASLFFTACFVQKKMQTVSLCVQVSLLLSFLALRVHWPQHPPCTTSRPITSFVQVDPHPSGISEAALSPEGSVANPARRQPHEGDSTAVALSAPGRGLPWELEGGYDLHTKPSAACLWHGNLGETELALFGYVLSLFWYVATGRRSGVGDLPLFAGFVGLEEFVLVISVTLVAVHMIAPWLLAQLVMNMIQSRRCCHCRISQRKLNYKWLFCLLLHQGWTNMLMVVKTKDFPPTWRSYAPKLLLEGSFVLVEIAAATFVIFFFVNDGSRNMRRTAPKRRS